MAWDGFGQTLHLLLNSSRDFLHVVACFFGRERSLRRQSAGHQAARRSDQALAGLDWPGLDRGRESRLSGRRGLHDQATKGCRLSARGTRRDRRQAGRLCDPRRRRAEDRRALFHVRRETVRSQGMVIAADGGGDCRSAGPWQDHDWSRRGESERTRRQPSSKRCMR